MSRIHAGGLLVLAALTFTAFLTIHPSDANARVCAAGVYRAGCVGPNGAAVVRRGPVACHYRFVWVNGVRVRRCL